MALLVVTIQVALESAAGGNAATGYGAGETRLGASMEDAAGQVSFSAHGQAEPAVSFRYPDESDSVTESTGSGDPATGRMVLRWAAEFFTESRTIRGQRVRVAATLYVLGELEGSIASIARKLKVSRQYFSRTVNTVRRVAPRTSVSTR